MAAIDSQGMPFGIKSAPEVFQKVMSQMVLDIEGAEAIIDDILVWGATQEEHDQRLKRVLDRSKEYNLKLNRGKCEIKRTEVKYCRASTHRRRSETGPGKDPSRRNDEKARKQAGTTYILRLHTVSREVHAAHVRCQQLVA